MSEAWSEAVRRTVFGSPMLRGIDASGRAAIEHAAALRFHAADAHVFGEGDRGDAVFVLVDGEVRLSAVRRGDDAPTIVRTVAPGDTFGEDALVDVGAPRRFTAFAHGRAHVVEIPATILWRGAGRSGAAALAEREQRLWRRRATADLLRTMAALRELPEPELELVLDALQHVAFERGRRIHSAGEPADAMWLIVDGLVQLQRPTDAEAVEVCAYLTRGDGFGDEDTLAGELHRLHAIALGSTRLLRLPGPALRTLVDRNPGVLQGMRRIATDRHAAQASIVAQADARSTRHVFHDLYRMQIARSLLVIDQSSCVRCGHCASTCAEVHGVARLVRRGDKVVTAVGDEEDARSLLVVNSCQHCKNPACMIDCPTGAIGRDPGGEVFIREALCTGCGNCAKACPWENIRMAPRSRPGGPDGRAVTLATKCDLCRPYTGPACVQACPTGAIQRLDPSRDVAEVGAVLGHHAATVKSAFGRGRAWWLVPAIAIPIAIAAAFGSARMHAAHAINPGHGLGLWAGVLAAVGIACALAYALPKRIPRLWLRRKPKAGAPMRGPTEAPPPRSRMRPHLAFHLAIGSITAAAVVAHAGARLPANPAGSLHVAFWCVTALGVLAAVAYRIVPPRLTALERVGALPEDLPAQREALVDALYREASGRSAEVKSILATMLVPYAHAAGGSLRLLVSGRTLLQERQRLHAAIERRFPGGTQQAGLDALVRIVVELRAWPLRRWLSRALLAFVPLHVVLTGVLVALLVLHVAVMLGLP